MKKSLGRPEPIQQERSTTSAVDLDSTVKINVRPEYIAHSQKL